MIFKQRSNELELIDIEPSQYTLEEYRDCILKMGRIGYWLGNENFIMRALKNLNKPIDAILDVGCGGGAFALRLAKEFPQAHVTGIDLAQDAITYAQERALANNAKNITFKIPATPELNEPNKSFDIVTSTLVCHHLDDATLIDFFKRAGKVARVAVILNDLHRHWLAYGAFSIIAPLLFNNRLIMHDGLISIKRGFKRKELVSLLEQAGYAKHQYSITWTLFFRWIVIIKV